MRLNDKIRHQPTISPSEWLAIFPKAKADYILPKLRQVESKIARLESIIPAQLRRSQNITDGWFLRELVKASDIAKLVDLKQELHRLQRYLPQPQSSGRVKQDRIERAKEYPILQIAETQLREIKKYGRTHRSLCPYHQERTPSFYLYIVSNTFHCFGCQEHGDVIALTQQLMSVGFIEAVKYLTPAYET